MSDNHEIYTQFYLDPEVIFSSHAMFINASLKGVYFYTFSDFHHFTFTHSNEVLLRL